MTPEHSFGMVTYKRRRDSDFAFRITPCPGTYPGHHASSDRVAFSMTTLDRFIERFGSEAAAKITDAAISHANGIHDDRGSDPFMWALLICLGSECLQRFSDYHGIAPSWEDIDAWLSEPEQREAARNYDGDVDYLALFVGVYNRFGDEPSA